MCRDVAENCFKPDGVYDCMRDRLELNASFGAETWGIASKAKGISYAACQMGRPLIYAREILSNLKIVNTAIMHSTPWRSAIRQTASKLGMHDGFYESESLIYSKS